MADPSVILDHYAQESFFLEEPEVDGLPRFALLYPTVSEMGPHTVGLVYDQERHCVTLPLSLDYIDSVIPVEENLDMWFPPETMLSNWINLVRIGKVVAQPDNDWPGPSIDVWRWHSYGAAQIDSAVAAFNRLTTAIEARMPANSLLSVNRQKHLLNNAELDEASVPDNCFIRSFLTQVKTPRFKAIAPGLEVPHNAVAFAARQKFTVMPQSNHEDDNDENYPMIPPVLIFAAADTSRTVNFDTENRYSRLNPFHQDVPRGDHSTPAGLYSESVRRLYFDNAEEGFRLLLPFQLREHDMQDQGARRSDGSLVTEGSVAELFQHGFLPFGGEHRTKRLERLLDRWREMVEGGIWKVGQHGVEGTIDTFRDADNGAWQDYWIPPGW